MDKIGNIEPSKESPFAALDRTKERVSKSFLKHAGFFIGSLLCLVCVLALTTDIDFQSIFALADLGAELFILMFCTYSMYITLFDSGRREGILNTEYKEAVNAHNEIKNKVKESGIHHLLTGFCKKYTEDELRGARTDILAGVGITYDVFEEKYLSLDASEIDRMEALSKREKKAIKSSIKLKPINITSDMFLKRGRGSFRRSPLGMSPEAKQMRVFLRKLVTITATSVLTAQMAFEIVKEPSLGMVATVLIKLLPVILNGFFGYKFGYDNVAVDTTNYISDQTDFLERFVRWAERV